MTTQWYYQLLMEEFGPVSDSAILELIDDGTLSSTDLVRPDDSHQWIPVSSLPSFDENAEDEFEDDDSDEETEPDDITDLSELSFDFEESGPSESRSTRSTRQLPSQQPQRVAPILGLAPEYYCQSIGQVLGPMSKQDLLGMAESGALSQEDLVRFGENGEWQAAHEMDEISAAFLLGDDIPAEPIASAPPSTRRLFPTAGKPLDTAAVESGSPNSNAQSAVNEAAGENSSSTTSQASESEAASPDTTLTSNGSVATVAESVADRTGAKKKAGSASLKKKKKRKANAEDDKLLDDIFDDVFADSDKSSSPMMPAASAAPASARSTGDKGTSSPSNDASEKRTESSLGNKGAVASVTTATAVATSGVSAAQPVLGAQPADAIASIPASPSPSVSALSSPALSSTPSASMSPLMSSAAKGSPSPVPLPKPKRDLSFSVSGPAIKALIGVVVVVAVGGLIWKMGLPSLGGISTDKYTTRLSEVLVEYKALGDDPSLGQWEQQSNKARQEFMTYYKAMMDAKATGPQNTACIEGIKAMIALAATPVEEKEKRKGLFDRIEKSLADMK